ncbi:MAG: hypothetical protein QGD90_00880 [Candidatus Hydrogenedentes bacterium]|nr:hypothetical protein [Candidatus Hydrogenedentota bacterium]
MRLSARIGAVEITGDAVRIAVVKTGGRLPKVLEMIEVPILARDDVDLHAAQVAAAREAAAQLESPPPMYVLSMPVAWSTIRLLTVPFRGKRKVASAAPFELEPFLAIPMEELIVDFLITRVVDNRSEVLAIAVQRKALEVQCAILEEAGIAVDGALLDAVSMTALWDAVRRKNAGTHAVLHLRERESVLAVVEGKRLTYLRRLESSARMLRSDPTAVARELRNILRARAADSLGENPVQSLTVTVSGLPEADCALFEDEFDIPVNYQVIVFELEGVDPDILPGYSEQEDDVTDLVNRWTGPIAAAYSAADGPFHMNFLQEQFSSASTRRTLANYAIATCLLGVVALLGFFGLVYADHRNNLERVEQLGQAVWEEFDATFPDLLIERPQPDIGGLESFDLMQIAAEEERSTTSTLSKEMFSRPTLLDILQEIGRHLPNSVATIQEMEIKVTKNMTITISGEIKDLEKFNESMKALENSKIFTIDTGRLKRALADGKETFVLTARR